MVFSELDINNIALNYFKENTILLCDHNIANDFIKSVCGINQFFESQMLADLLVEYIKNGDANYTRDKRREYGDFQTNPVLAKKVTAYAAAKNPDVEFVLEPTCGKGTFILSSIKTYKNLKKIVGIEVYLPYVWETKFNILSYYLENLNDIKPEIEILHANVFDYDFAEMSLRTIHLNTLIIGNPPWVTNAELGTVNSQNLPIKSNFKGHNGFDAITGKGNFDIGEYISLLILNAFQNHGGNFAFLIKNSVVKNIIYDQPRNKYKIGNCEMLNIDAKSEFNASVHASLFISSLNASSENSCKEYNFYDNSFITNFGWNNNKFVYSMDNYGDTNFIDGKFPYIWRSGVKHDCSKIMEFESFDSNYKNAIGDEFKIEDDLVFSLLKSSDLKNKKAPAARKKTIITQKKVGQETNYIKSNFPLTYTYLNCHREKFDERKSSIYKDKPAFSIFGIGDYSFSKYKVAISGLYKSTHFTLVEPVDGKAVMVDDTCYSIGFEDYFSAEIVHCLLNSVLVQNFLKSIIFPDAKRPINKDILMRIDLLKVLEYYGFQGIREHLPDLSLDEWEKFLISLQNTEENLIQN